MNAEQVVYLVIGCVLLVVLWFIFIEEHPPQL